MTINQIQDKIISDFELFDEWEDRYAYIIELGKKLSPLPTQYRTEELRVKGCQSNVWVLPQSQKDKITFQADSDAIIVKGIVSLLVNVLSDQKASDIAQADLYFIEKIGLKEHLSMTRANGLSSMIQKMINFAKVAAH